MKRNVINHGKDPARALGSRGRGNVYRRMGQAGRFRMGPYYVQNDWWCTGAESLIRNALIGHAQASRFEALQTTCYMPDTFGFPASLPMFARGFGSDVIRRVLSGREDD